VGLGAASSGYMMSSTTMVLEFGRREDIAMRIALSSTAEGAMAALAPLCGGLLAAALGYPVLFAISMALQGGALLLLLLRVREPRRRQPSSAS
jgi:MFS family permease